MSGFRDAADCGLAGEDWPEQNNGIHNVAPVDRYAAIPELIILAASEAFPVRTDPLQGTVALKIEPSETQKIGVPVSAAASGGLDDRFVGWQSPTIHSHDRHKQRADCTSSRSCVPIRPVVTGL